MIRPKFVFVIVCALSVFLMAPLKGQETSEPFASVDAAFKKNRLQWSQASTPFQSARVQLGQNFERELWKYLGDDVHKQDRIANFLIYPGYLHGNLPMPDLARRIHLKILSLTDGKPDLSSRVAFVTASINAAVESAELELTAEAKRHKENAVKMMAADKFLASAAAPAMEDYDSCVYDAIGDAKIASPASACLNKKSANDPKITEMEVGEVSKEKVISKPEPQWPKGAAAGTPSGTLSVKVRIDESGQVELAEAPGGPPALQDAAVAAARKARFQKTMYQGAPVKVRGWLAYAF